MKPLTSRELTCLRWAAIGKTSWEMGIILGLTERTVNFHIGNACRKLDVHSRQAAIAMALQHGYLFGITEPLSGYEEIRRPGSTETTPGRPSPTPLSRHHPSTRR